MAGKNEKRKPRKTSYSDAEWEEINLAVKEGGFRNWHEMSLYLIRSYKEKENNDVKRKISAIAKGYAEVNTCLNQIRYGINVEQNMKKSEIEVNRLCQEYL